MTADMTKLRIKISDLVRAVHLREIRKEENADRTKRTLSSYCALFLSRLRVDPNDKYNIDILAHSFA